jgi:cystathionine beta-lyase/cystathionine gamma-synthase
MKLGYKVFLTGMQEIIDLDADLKEGDLVWLETPLNPTGEVRYLF